MAVLAAAFCGSGRTVSAQYGPPAAAQESAEFAGRTEAAQTVQISSREAGTLATVLFRGGERVRKGDVLFELDARPAQAAVELARAELAQAKAEMAAAQTDAARMRQLVTRGAVSREEMDRAAARADAAAAKTKAAESAVIAAESKLQDARIVAPIAGRIGRPAVDAGNLVQPGTVLATLVSEDPICVSFDVPEKVYLQLSRQRQRDGGAAEVKELQIPVEVGLADEQGFPHKGQLDFVDNHADPKTGTVRCRAVLPNPDRTMIPGLSMHVRMPLGKASPPGDAAKPPESLR